MTELSPSPRTLEKVAQGDVVVWAEIGRARMPLYRLLGIPVGSVVDLDRQPGDPVDLYVNGRRFAIGRLEIADGEWAVRVERTFLRP